MSIRERQTGKQLEVPIPALVHLLGDNPVCAWDKQTLLLWELMSKAPLGKKKARTGHEELWRERSGEANLLQGEETRTGNGR